MGLVQAYLHTRNLARRILLAGNGERCLCPHHEGIQELLVVGDTAALILNFSTTGSHGQRHAPASYTEEITPDTNKEDTGCTPELAGTFCKKKKKKKNLLRPWWEPNPEKPNP